MARSRSRWQRTLKTQNQNNETITEPEKKTVNTVWKSNIKAENKHKWTENHENNLLDLGVYSLAASPDQEIHYPSGGSNGDHRKFTARAAQWNTKSIGLVRKLLLQIRKLHEHYVFVSPVLPSVTYPLCMIMRWWDEMKRSWHHEMMKRKMMISNNDIEYCNDLHKPIV